MPDRWATFDRYGTLIDWNPGIGDALQSLWPAADRAVWIDRLDESSDLRRAGEPPDCRELPAMLDRLVS